jgi:predicted HTH transcriptional regulator
MDKNYLNNINILNKKEFIYNEELNIYEDFNYEFKQFRLNSPKDVLNQLKLNMKYLCAFLNSNNGFFFFGINNNGIVKGIQMTDEIRDEMDLSLKTMIDLFPSHVRKNNLINYNFFKVLHTEDDEENNYIPSYIVIINVSKGLDNYIYTTPYKDDEEDDYICYIKLNGTIKKLTNYELNKYIKTKIKKYVYKSLKK